MTDDEIYSAVVRWFASTTSVLFIRAHEDGDRPEGVYGVVNMTGYVEVREHPQTTLWVRNPDGPNGESNRSVATPLIETEWQFSIHVYGEGGSDVLRPVRSAFHLSQANEPLLPNLVIFDISQVRKVPEYVNEQWEDRAQMDFMVRGLTRDGILQDTIETYSFDIERFN